MNTDVPAIVDGIREVASTFQSFTGVDLLATKIPLVNKSIGDLLGSVPESLKLSGDAVTGVGETTEETGQKSFNVDVDGVQLVNEGVAVGDKVSYRGSDGGTHEGTVTSVGSATLTVSFASTLDQEPDRSAPQLEVFRGGGLGDQLAGLLGQSASTLVNTGTIQGLIEEIADRLGIDLDKFNLLSTGTGVDRVITVSLPLDIQPWTFDEQLDLSEQIPGLGLSASGNFQIVIDPEFNITIGIRTTPGISPAERVFIVDNPEPEVTLNFSAQLDDPVIQGSLGILDLTLSEQSLPVNDGLKITGTITINLNEPVVDDGRISLGELTGSLTEVVKVGVDLRFDIDGLELKPGGSLAGALGSIIISLDGDAGGHVTSLGDLTNLPSAINIQGLDDFLNFDNLSALALQRILEQLRLWLDQARGSSVFATNLPLTDKTLGDVVDLGTAFFDNVVNALDNPRLVADNLAAANGQLDQDVSLSLSLNDETDLNFTILASQTDDNTSLEDLADDARAALVFALAAVGLPAVLDVGVRQGALTIYAKTDDVKGLAVSAGNSLLGFAKDQIADEIGYRSLDEFFEILAQHLPGALNPNYDTNTNLLTFTLSFDKSLTSNLPLDLGLNLGALAEISTSSDISILAQAIGSLQVGINLSDLTSGFQLQQSMPLASLNGGKGVGIPSDSPTQLNDLRITLRDGSTVNVDLSSSFTTVGEVLTAITNASPFLTATIDPDTQQAIRLTDTSTFDGVSIFSVSSLPGSLAALDLGLVGADADGDGVITGGALHGVSSSDRFFIDATNSTLSGDLSLIANDVDATARAGFVDVSVVNGTGTATASASVSLTDPGMGANNDGRITFDELFDALANDPGQPDCRSRPDRLGQFRSADRDQSGPALAARQSASDHYDDRLVRPGHVRRRGRSGVRFARGAGELCV